MHVLCLQDLDSIHNCDFDGEAMSNELDTLKTNKDIWTLNYDIFYRYYGAYECFGIDKIDNEREKIINKWKEVLLYDVEYHFFCSNIITLKNSLQNRHHMIVHTIVSSHLTEFINLYPIKMNYFSCLSNTPTSGRWQSACFLFQFFL